MTGRLIRATGVLLAGVVFAGCETYKPYMSSQGPPPTLKRAAVME